MKGDELKFLLLCHVISSPPCFEEKKKNFYLKTWHIMGILVAAAVIQILKWGEELILRIF